MSFGLKRRIEKREVIELEGKEALMRGWMDVKIMIQNVKRFWVMLIKSRARHRSGWLKYVFNCL